MGPEELCKAVKIATCVALNAVDLAAKLCEDEDVHFRREVWRMVGELIAGRGNGFTLPPLDEC